MQKINLENNWIGDIGAQALAKTVAKTRTLHALYLSGKNIRVKVGGQSLETALRTNYSIYDITVWQRYEFDRVEKELFAPLINRNRAMRRQRATNQLSQMRRVCILLAFLRANRNHEYRYSILPLVREIMKLLDKPNFVFHKDSSGKATLRLL